MLKRQAIQKIYIASLALFIVFLISLFPNNQKNNYEEIINIKEEKTMPIYSLDKNNYVARISVIKEDSEIVPYIISLLTINSQKASYLPSFFKPIIPENTKIINYDISDGTLKINFSKEFLNIKAKDEEKLIETLVYSLCEQEEIKNIIIFVEGEILDKLPSSNKSLNIPLDRQIGINKVYDVSNFKNIKQTTVYYANKVDEDLYYIPITKISNENASKVEIIVNELKKVPIYQTNLISFLNAAYELSNYEILENKITLSFNNKLIAGLKEDENIEEVKYTLALSLRDTYNLDNIVINIA